MEIKDSKSYNVVISLKDRNVLLYFVLFGVVKHFLGQIKSFDGVQEVEFDKIAPVIEEGFRLFTVPKNQIRFFADKVGTYFRA